MGKCVLCSASATVNTQDNASRTIYNCQNCGVFVVSDLVDTQVKEHRCELSAYFTNRNLAGHTEVVLVSFEKAKKDKDYLQLTVNQILSHFPASFTDRMDLVLENLAILSSHEGEEIKIERLDQFPLFYVKKATYDAMSFVIKSMQKLDLLEVNYYSSAFFPCGVVVSPKGWDRLSKLHSGKVDTNMALVLHSDKEDERSALFGKLAAKAVRECGFSVMESNTASAGGKVNHEMISLIKECKFIVTDMTGADGAAYYAAGMAKALGKINILSCHSGSMKKLDMDTEQISVLGWKAEEELYLQILNAIRALVQ